MRFDIFMWGSPEHDPALQMATRLGAGERSQPTPLAKSIYTNSKGARKCRSIRFPIILALRLSE